MPQETGETFEKRAQNIAPTSSTPYNNTQFYINEGYSKRDIKDGTSTLAPTHSASSVLTFTHYHDF
jgi:hypothetical protein